MEKYGVSNVEALQKEELTKTKDRIAELEASNEKRASHDVELTNLRRRQLELEAALNQ